MAHEHADNDPSASKYAGKEFPDDSDKWGIEDCRCRLSSGCSSKTYGV